MLKIFTGIGVSSVFLVGLSLAYFNDVPSTHPHAEAIGYVESEGIVNGYSDGTFRPDNVINRVELLKILVEAQASPNDRCGVSALYTDTDSTAWYQPYLEAAACRGIATGYQDQSFKPGNPVLAVEAFKMITKTFGYALGQVSGEWYMPYLDILASKLAIPRTIEAPDSELTRAQMAEMIYRLETSKTGSPGSHTVETLLSRAAQVVETYGNTVTITNDGTYRYIKSNGLPNHETGEFPSRGNPNTISAQDIDYRVPTNPVYTAQTTPARVTGVALNGVSFEPGTAERWNGDNNWAYEGIQAGVPALGLDFNMAHVQPTGLYHYHATPTSLVELVAAQNSDDQILLGYAADGHGLYYSQSGIYQPSYRVKSGTRPSGPGGEYDGTFTQDFEYVDGLGDLDECNGRFVNGEYRYFITEDFPYIPRCLHGVADSSFDKGGGGQLGSPAPTQNTSMMPHEVCEQMSAQFNRNTHSCAVRDTPTNELLCMNGRGSFSSGVCQFMPPGGR